MTVQNFTPFRNCSFSLSELNKLPSHGPIKEELADLSLPPTVLSFPENDGYHRESFETLVDVVAKNNEAEVLLHNDNISERDPLCLTGMGNAFLH